MEEAENNQNETPIQNKVYQGRRKSISKKKKIDSFVCNVNKSSAKYTKDNSNDEDNEDNHSAEEEQNTKDSESVKTPPVKKRGRPKKLSGLMRINRRLLIDKGIQGKAMMNRKSKQLVLKEKEENTKANENKKNSKIHTRTTPTVLFNAMAILNGDRKKCLHEMGFGSMIGMGIHELSGKLESLAPRSPDDPFFKQWFSQFGEKNEVRPNDITDVIVSTKDAEKIDWCTYIITCLKESKQKWVNPKKNHYTGPLTFMILLYLHSTRCDDIDVIRKTPAIKNWKSVHMQFEKNWKLKNMEDSECCPNMNL
nr:hypothetical protein [Tanacetum cinerariifolium]